MTKVGLHHCLKCSRGGVAGRNRVAEVGGGIAGQAENRAGIPSLQLIRFVITLAQRSLHEGDGFKLSK